MSQINIVENKPRLLLIDVFNANKTTRALVISDLHIGKTYWLQNTGISIDWYHIVKEIEKELSVIVISNKVTSIVLLGDVKNNIYKVKERKIGI